MKKVKFVDLVFENCEVARLKPDMFRGLVAHKITKTYDVNCAQYKSGEISEYLHCEFFAIVINKEGLDKAKLEPDITLKDSPQNLRERLKRWKDITHVDLIFSERRTKKNKLIKRDSIYISVPWPKDEQFENHYQKHIVFDNTDDNSWLREGEMKIEICDNRHIS